MEIWKPVRGYKGYYEISNLGKVKSLSRFDRIGRRVKEKLLTLIPDEGYLKVQLSKNGKSVKAKHHRLLALAFIPNPKRLPLVNHKNGIKSANWLDNLEWSTVRDNNIHAIKMGLRIKTQQKRNAASACS